MHDSMMQRLRKAGEEVFDHTPVAFAYLFGSLAAGTSRPDSDVDVAVYLESDGTRDRDLDLSLDLAEEVSRAAGVGNLEVVVMNRAPLPLLGRILKTRSVLYSRDEPARVQFESRTLREFFDFEIHAGPMDEKFLRDMAEGRR